MQEMINAWANAAIAGIALGYVMAVPVIIFTLLYRKLKK